MSGVRVTVEDRTHALAGDAPFTFGRSTSCAVCLDPDDAAISRLAGSIEYDERTWWLVNRSSVRPLSVIDELGLRSVLAPGRRTALDAPVSVVVDGTYGTHTLHVETPTTEPTGRPDLPEPGEDQATEIGEEVLVNTADRAALVALFAGYLEDPPRHDPNPKSYAAAAARLGWPRTTLVKRIEYLRTRLTAAGVPNLTGWNALSNLAEYALSTGLISKRDLKLVRQAQEAHDSAT
jgi:hypothetical protein